MTKRDLRITWVNSFRIYHNCTDGSFPRYVVNWSENVKHLSALSFVNYIDLCGLGWEAFTEEQYYKLPL